MKRVVEKTAAFAMDGIMCGMMNVMQWRRSDQVCSSDELDAYLDACGNLTREEFYRPGEDASIEMGSVDFSWPSPISSGFGENDVARMRYYPCATGPKAPTLLLLHALMSASDIGYRKLALWFNERGWNVVFPHLPYHYSRKPRGYFNGELAITANLIRNAETLRQGVVELRQVMNVLRGWGCTEFGLIGTSLGGWIGALLSFLEEDFRFIALIQPIVNVEHAIWDNPGAESMRRMLRARGIERRRIGRHSHLSSPLHGLPLTEGRRIVITAGLYDTVAPASELILLQQRWPGARLVNVRQGHFGYAALRETVKQVEPFL